MLESIIDILQKHCVESKRGGICFGGGGIYKKWIPFVESIHSSDYLGFDIY